MEKSALDVWRDALASLQADIKETDDHLRLLRVLEKHIKGRIERAAATNEQS